MKHSYLQLYSNDIINTLVNTLRRALLHTCTANVYRALQGLYRPVPVKSTVSACILSIPVPFQGNSVEITGNPGNFTDKPCTMHAYEKPCADYRGSYLQGSPVQFTENSCTIYSDPI